jgi:hypothetical protein
MIGETEMTYAHNWFRSGDGCIPVVTEFGDHIPPAELAREWHEASDAEYRAYLEYWNAKYDAFERGEITDKEL